MRIVLVDDHEVVRVGLATVLRRQPGFEVVGEAATGEAAVEIAGRLRPDVVVMDVRLPGQGGIDACRQIRERYPEVNVIMLTSYRDDTALFASIDAGAAGFVLKEIDSAKLLEAIETVGRGESALDPAMASKVLARLRGGTGGHGEPGAETSVEPLTRREQDILELIGEGKTNREIASQLYLSENTVRNYVSSILSKLNLSNRAQVALYVARRRRTYESGDGR